MPAKVPASVVSGNKSIEISGADGEKITIPFRNISYFSELPANQTLGEPKRLKIVTMDGTAHSITVTQIDAFKSKYSTWLASSAFTL